MLRNKKVDKRNQCCGGPAWNMTHPIWGVFGPLSLDILVFLFERCLRFVWVCPVPLQGYQCSIQGYQPFAEYLGFVKITTATKQFASWHGWYMQNMNVATRPCWPWVSSLEVGSSEAPVGRAACLVKLCWCGKAVVWTLGTCKNQWKILVDFQGSPTFQDIPATLGMIRCLLL